MPDPPEDAGFTETAPEDEWLDSMAAEAGISREVVFEQLIGAHWALTEIARVIEDTSKGIGYYDNWIRSDAETQNGGLTRGSIPPRNSEELSDISDRIDGIDERLSEIEETGDEPGVEEAIRELRQQFRTVVEHANVVPPMQAGEGTSQGALSSIEDRLTRLENTDRTETTNSPSSTSIRELADRQSTFEQAITDRHDSLEAWINTEFEHVRTILEHLVATTNELDERVHSEVDTAPTTGTQQPATSSEKDTRIDSLAAKLDEVQKRQGDYEKANALRQAVEKHGLTEATCERCESSIEVSFLQIPYCPVCTTEFDEFLPATGWFGFGTNWLTVADAAPADGQTAAVDQPVVEESDSAESLIIEWKSPESVE